MGDYKLLQWDSNFLGFKVASVFLNSSNSNELKVILNRLREEQFKLAYLQLKPQDVALNTIAVENNGFLADEKTTFCCTINTNEQYGYNPNIEYYKHREIDEDIYSIAIESGHKSRFKIDPRFDSQVQEKMYRIWIEKSINGEMADEVITYRENNKTLGLITVKKQDNIGVIGLVGVQHNVQGKGIGSKMMNVTKQWFASNDVFYIEVVTQANNTMACNYYKKCGFQIKEVVNYYHFWL